MPEPFDIGNLPPEELNWLLVGIIPPCTDPSYLQGMYSLLTINWGYFDGMKALIDNPYTPSIVLEDIIKRWDDTTNIDFIRLIDKAEQILRARSV